MKQPLKILNIEDSEHDFELTQRLLKKDGLPCEMVRIKTRTELFNALENDDFDIILSDYRLPGFSGLQALKIVHALKPEIPFIIVSGVIGEDMAIESFNMGATDYVLKDRISRLPSALRRAMSDVEKQKAYRQMQQAVLEARRLKTLNTLSSGIAHDFSNVLVSIRGHTSLLALEHQNPEKVLETTQVLIKAVDRGADLVKELREFAQKSDGEMKTQDINICVLEVLAPRREKLPTAITMQFVPANDLPAIQVNSCYLGDILDELTANAVEAMTEGGAITVSTSLVSGTKIDPPHPNLADTDYVCLQVADTGKGIESSVQQQVFEPFYTTKERGRGSGLGLPVVDGLMRAHNGSMTLASEPQTGTVVSLFFPTTTP